MLAMVAAENWYTDHYAGPVTQMRHILQGSNINYNERRNENSDVKLVATKLILVIFCLPRLVRCGVQRTMSTS